MGTETSEQITRKSASNLALAFALLPPHKQSAMSALYAFCREVDDVADEESVPQAQRREQLAAWREDVRKACTGGTPQFTVNRELQPIIAEFRLPYELFDELILGVESDLDTFRFATHAELDLYCYRVASVVGLLSIEIFGYQDPRCRDYAIALGKALQLTNILRDVGNDAARGRIYIPLEDLKRFNVTPEEILAGQSSDRFLRLAEDLAGRARRFYQEARTLLPAAERRSMVAAELMGTVYWKLLRHLESRRFPVLGTIPCKLSRTRKILLVLFAWIRFKLHLPFARYGV
jgi:phytoene synthase